MKRHFRKLAGLLFLSALSMNSFAVMTAPVSGFAIEYPSRKPIDNATLTILENGTKIVTDAQGKFGPFNWPVGETITLVLEKSGYHTTQSATITVPQTGLNDDHHNITFQVPTEISFYMLAIITGAKLDPNSCHVTSTITAHGKTLQDAPQGEEHSKVTLNPSTSETPFYFGIFTSGPMKDSTNPFVRGLTETSLDGGVAFFNLTPSDQLYTISAMKDGDVFSEAKFYCRKGMFVNLSPPQGPTVL